MFGVFFPFDPPFPSQGCVNSSWLRARIPTARAVAAGRRWRLPWRHSTRCPGGQSPGRSTQRVYQVLSLLDIFRSSSNQPTKIKHARVTTCDNHYCSTIDCDYGIMSIQNVQQWFLYDINLYGLLGLQATQGCYRVHSYRRWIARSRLTIAFLSLVLSHDQGWSNRTSSPDTSLLKRTG